ncbi:glycoside hydrolase family 43 protein [Glycomyces buryatensis]|uniref:Glycoside hydrolase family 43 protein n=1 Tax=Glycomyces buryatensis TaxID=2570927 RepID=A0A4S8Q7Y4_9ACTN|nr:glycoside hydrolase family 43 protein [Glycomyces buryatensis]THV40477.1 glycoside hydrolase family 43 protein [Glycomyces buryatensis]
MTNPTPLPAAEHPIIPGFYPDPTICRVGDDYYLANSSFEYFPGAPIFHSRDLLSWKQIGNILDRRSQFLRNNWWHSGGIYGSTLRHHDGRFYFVTTNVGEAGQLIVTAEDPSGPWSDPVIVPGAAGIDPDLCWDESGQCYLTWKGFNDGNDGIFQARLDLETGEFKGEAYPVWQGLGLAAPEAPHLYRIGEYWYLMLAEGGTERGHTVTIARGERPEGPFEPCPDNPVFSHRSTAKPVQNTGHADLVQSPDGTWAAVYLAVRPGGFTPQFHVLGRETFLAGIEWVDGWPVFDEDRFQIPATDTAFTDDFTGVGLDQRWVAPGSEPEAVVVGHPDGGVALQEGAGPLCARIRDLRWGAEAVFSGSGRLGVLMDDRHVYGLNYAEGQVSAVVVIGGLRHELGSVPCPGEDVVLRIDAVDPRTEGASPVTIGPDDIVLSFDAGDGPRELGRFDGRYLSTEVTTGFTGRMLAVEAAGPGSRLQKVEYRPS